MQTVQVLEESKVFTLVENFETLLRTWNVKGRSVRPDHRMVAHSGFITVARKVDARMWHAGSFAETTDVSSQNNNDLIKEDEHIENRLDTL